MERSKINAGAHDQHHAFEEFQGRILEDIKKDTARGVAVEMDPESIDDLRDVYEDYYFLEDAIEAAKTGGVDTTGFLKSIEQIGNKKKLLEFTEQGIKKGTILASEHNLAYDAQHRFYQYLLNRAHTFSQMREEWDILKNDEKRAMDRELEGLRTEIADSDTDDLPRGSQLSPIERSLFDTVTVPGLAFHPNTPPAVFLESERDRISIMRKAAKCTIDYTPDSAPEESYRLQIRLLPLTPEQLAAEVWQPTFKIIRARALNDPTTEIKIPPGARPWLHAKAVQIQKQARESLQAERARRYES